MENLVFTLPVRAMSYNHYIAQTKSGRRFISSKGKEYHRELCSLLSPHKQDLFEFGHDVVWPTMFRLEIRYYYKNYLTKKDEHNKKCNDVDNPNKILIDTLFSFMGLDDYLLGELICTKHPAIEKDTIFINLSKFEDHQLRIF